MRFRRTYNAIRTVIKAVRTGKIQFIDVKGRGEDFTDKELFQHYGHASRPLPESEGILLFLGGVDNAIVIATEDRRYRIALEEGEVAIYTDEGDKVHLKRNKEINIHSGGKVMVDAVTLIDLKVGTPPKGVVQGDCICHFTGLPHGDLSTTVTASKG